MFMRQGTLPSRSTSSRTSSHHQSLIIFLEDYIRNVYEARNIALFDKSSSPSSFFILLNNKTMLKMQGTLQIKSTVNALSSLRLKKTEKFQEFSKLKSIGPIWSKPSTTNLFFGCQMIFTCQNQI